MRLRRLFAPLLVSLFAGAVLTGCGGDAREGDDDRMASGEVLEASLSDEMIPLDRLNSQPPLIRERAAASGSAADEGDSGIAIDEGPGENPLETGGEAQ